MKRSRFFLKYNNVVNYLFMLFVCTLSACKTMITSSETKVEAFKGTIVYKVEVVQKTDSNLSKNKKAVLGNEMYLTIFKNGDIQRKYNGASSMGYDLQYLDLENGKIIEKYNSSDSLFESKANIQNITKVYDLKLSDSKETILSYDLAELSVGAKEAATAQAIGNYLTIRYWYTDALKIDKTLYATVNNDLWSYFMYKSDGSIFLKYEVDYFTYKVVYTATEILPGKYEKYKEKLSDLAPRVTE